MEPKPECISPGSQVTLGIIVLPVARGGRSGVKILLSWEIFFFSYGQNKEGGSKGRAYMYTYGSFMLRFDIKQPKSIKQLSFN